MTRDDVWTIRTGLGLSVTEFAALIGTDRGTVSGWERGDGLPNAIQERFINALWRMVSQETDTTAHTVH